MPLCAGAKLGPYEILSPIGSGGMGEVYKARDTRLYRTVAIKVLPEHIARREDLRTRFEREARAVASLNHPHICVLFDIGQTDDTEYMVMECLEGETLAARIGRGALPLDLALKIAIQAADALDRAHRSGVVHRDVKPSNVMLTRDGVKVLDFGLARTVPDSNDATLTLLTASRTLLGTPQYMSPEQWEGTQADERSDVFAFGCVVYEMVTGRPAFERQSNRGSEPLPISQSKALQELVSICLAKDPEDRWQSMRDVRLRLQSIAHAPSENVMAAPHARSRRWARIGIATGIGLLSALAGWLARPYEPMHTYQVSISPPDGGIFLSARSNQGGSAVSPDGTLLAFVARTDGKVQLWVRRLDSLAARPLPGTEGASYPFWSPDNLHIGFFTPGKLKAIEIAQGPPRTLCDAVAGRGGSWNARGDIIFAAFSTGRTLHRIAASGGASTPVSTLDTALGDVFHFWPHFLPDGRHYIYLARTAKAETTGIRVGTLDATAPRKDRLLFPAISNAAYAGPARLGWFGKAPGHLFFLRDGSLLAQAFDPADLEVKGDPFPIVEHVGYERTIGLVDFSASSNGTLAYGSVSGVRSQLIWRDRAGKQLGSLEAGTDLSAPRLSPDGTRMAFSRLDSTHNPDIWVGEVGATASRFTEHPSFDGYPAWSPNGNQIVFTSQAPGVYNLYRKDSHGAGEPERLAPGAILQYDSDWSRNGLYLLFTEAGGKTGQDLMVLPLAGSRKYSPFLQTRFDESQGRFSPDGRWIAYTSNETRTNEVYVQSFVPGQQATGARSKVSSGGGSQPRWRWDGNELFYLSPDQKIMAASVRLGSPSFQAGPPATLFSTRVPTIFDVPWHYEVTHDGQRFILLESAMEIESEPMTLVINWQSGTQR